MAAATKEETGKQTSYAATSQESDDLAKQEDAESRHTCFAMSFIAVGLCIIICAATALYYNWEEFFKYLFNTMEENKEHQVLIALGINTLLTILIVCCLPGPGLCMIFDGFFFGFWKGFALGFTGELIAYIISIFLARTYFKDSIREWLTTHSTLRELVLICEEDPSGKFLLLMRFLAVPVWAKNYTIGVLEVEWLKAILVFTPGASFWVAKFVYIGYKSRQMAEAMSRGDQGKIMEKFSGMELIAVGISATVMLLLTTMGWYEYSARRAALDTDETKPLKEGC